MASNGGPRAWAFLPRNPEFEAAAFPVRIQSMADGQTRKWGLLAWEDPHKADGPASPFWAGTPMLEGERGTQAPPLANAGARLSGLVRAEPLDGPNPGSPDACGVAQAAVRRDRSRLLSGRLNGCATRSLPATAGHNGSGAEIYPVHDIDTERARIITPQSRVMWIICLWIHHRAAALRRAIRKQGQWRAAFDPGVDDAIDAMGKFCRSREHAPGAGRWARRSPPPGSCRR